MTAFAHLSSSELDKLTEAALTPRLGAEDQALLKMLLQGKQPIALNPPKLPARPRTGFSRHAKRRAEVRQAALALFAERGVAQTSLTRIASKLERSAGALRALYPDKAALLAEILQAHLAALLEAVDAAAAPKESAPRTRLEAMAAACLKLLAGEGAAVQRIFASAFALLDEAGKAAVQSKREALEARFAEAITAAVAPLLPAVPGAFATMLARSMLTILESAALGSAAAGGDTDGGDSAAAAAQAAVAGILAMAAPGPEPSAEGPSPPTASGPEPPPAQPTPPGASPTPGPSPHAGAGPQVRGEAKPAAHAMHITRARLPGAPPSPTPPKPEPSPPPTATATPSRGCETRGPPPTHAPPWRSPGPRALLPPAGAQETQDIGDRALQ